MENMKASEKFLLTIREASVYFGIGEKKLRRMVEDNEGGFSIVNGNRYLIIRPQLEQYFIHLAEKGAIEDGESDTGE